MDRSPFPESEALIRTFEGHSDTVNACAFSPDGRLIVSGSNDETVKGLGHRDRGRVADTDRPHLLGDACAFSPDGGRIVSGGDGRDPTVKVWDVETGDELDSLEGHNDDVNACAYSPGGERIVSASHDRTLTMWDAETGAELHILEGHAGWVNDCAFSPDGRLIVSGSRDESLKVWDAESGDVVATLPLWYAPQSIAAHPWLPRVVCGALDGALHRVELMGMAYGAIVVTAVDRSGGSALRCPACFEAHPLEKLAR